MVSRVVFMCGPAGSGKSTYAKALERRGMARLSFDAEYWDRGVDAAEAPEDVRHEVEADLRSRLLDLVAQGRDVVLDFSFSTRQMRDDYRALLRPAGVEPETVFFDTPRDVVVERVLKRRGSHADDVVLADEHVKRYFDHFEVPTQAEGPLTVISEPGEPSGPDPVEGTPPPPAMEG